MSDENESGGYLGNPLLKKAGEAIEFTSEMLQEYMKCMNDPIYFSEKYIQIVHVDKGQIPIKLYEYQKEIIKSSHENRFVIVNSSRQSGKTTTASCIILHYILFNESKTVGLLSNKADSAREIMDRIQLAYQNLPKWLQHGVLEWNKGSMKLENGCKVIASSSSASSIRGKSVAFLYIDEMAFIDGWEEFYSSVYPTVTSGKETKILFTSTPKGLNHFYKFCSDAMEPDDDNFDDFEVGVTPGKNGFIYHEIPWNRVPGRDEEWKKQTLAGIGNNEDQFSQEYACAFTGSTDNLISTAALHNMVEKKPITDISGMKQYEKPLPNKIYALVADVSRGKGLDYSAFSIIDATQMPYKQVCVYNNNEVGPIDYATIIHTMAKLYNDAMVLVEINDIGGQVADVLALDFGYENLLSTQTNGRSGKRISGGFGRNTERGIRTSAKVKLIGCSVMKMMIEQQQLLIHDATTINQLKRFVKKGDSYEAERGGNDDLVMTLVLFAWLADQSYFREITDINTLRRLRDNTDEEIDNMSLRFFYTSDEGEFSTWEEL